MEAKHERGLCLWNCSFKAENIEGEDFITYIVEEPRVTDEKHTLLTEKSN